ncbi:protein UPSTREAM OF FLC-like isoform X2 [Asparagus officinalis]|uniref:protein UPSTREAM OF FLC-like isoform X2 n=1 Tax=Asparagus officinalis TaxID=4686 RepID=UPI00098E2B4C|nr:protein UPSTREAM OF FLC-like isoform X2 [Asparagus officinalis]
MAIQSRRRAEAGISPERRMVWIEPTSSKKPGRRIAVVYYLSRNGHLEHPHFMEVPLSSSHGLYLKDVINRLNALRGRGMASMYSWSSKRSYKNGFVWQDLSDDDFIYPAHGLEYVLKGSELPLLDLSSRSISQDSSSSSTGSDRAPDLDRKKKKKSPWDSFDLNEYKVSRSDLIVDASTQTEEKKIRSKLVLDREEIEIGSEDRAVGSGRFRASEVLMQIVSCGSASMTRGGAAVLTRGGSDSGSPVGGKEGCFSGSLIEAKKKADSDGDDGDSSVFSLQKRSYSFNAADYRGSQKAGKAVKEINDARAKCVPRKNKASTTTNATMSKAK